MDNLNIIESTLVKIEALLNQNYPGLNYHLVLVYLALTYSRKNRWCSVHEHMFNIEMSEWARCNCKELINRNEIHKMQLHLSDSEKFILPEFNLKSGLFLKILSYALNVLEMGFDIFVDIPVWTSDNTTIIDWAKAKEKRLSKQFVIEQKCSFQYICINEKRLLDNECSSNDLNLGVKIKVFVSNSISDKFNLISLDGDKIDSFELEKIVNKEFYDRISEY